MNFQNWAIWGSCYLCRAGRPEDPKSHLYLKLAFEPVLDVCLKVNKDNRKYIKTVQLSGQLKIYSHALI